MSSSTISVNGNVYKKEDLSKEAVPMAEELAKNAHILPGSLLSAGTDFSAEDEKELQT